MLTWSCTLSAVINNVIERATESCSHVLNSLYILLSRQFLWQFPSRRNLTRITISTLHLVKPVNVSSLKLTSGCHVFHLQCVYLRRVHTSLLEDRFVVCHHTTNHTQLITVRIDSLKTLQLAANMQAF